MERGERKHTDTRSLALCHGREEFWVLMAFIARPCGVGAQGIIEGSFYNIVSIPIMVFLYSESVQEVISQNCGGEIYQSPLLFSSNF